MHPELSEFDCGIWSGTPLDAAGRSIGARDPEVPVPGGESLAHAWERVSRFRAVVGLDRLTGCSVVIGHVVINHLLVATLRGVLAADEALRGFPLHRSAPGSVAELHRIDSTWRLHTVRHPAPAMPFRPSHRTAGSDGHLPLGI